jgi:hypothetical protein
MLTARISWKGGRTQVDQDAKPCQLIRPLAHAHGAEAWPMPKDLIEEAARLTPTGVEDSQVSG